MAGRVEYEQHRVIANRLVCDCRYFLKEVGDKTYAKVEKCVCRVSDSGWRDNMPLLSESFLYWAVKWKATEDV